MPFVIHSGGLPISGALEQNIVIGPAGRMLRKAIFAFYPEAKRFQIGAQLVNGRTISVRFEVRHFGLDKFELPQNIFCAF